MVAWSNLQEVVALTTRLNSTGDQPGQTPGYLPNSGQEGGYFWWVGGGMFGTSKF